MEILLTTLNSKYVHSNLALRYLYAGAGRHRDRIKICEYTINHTDDYLYTELMRQDSRLFCFSCYIWNIERTLYVAEMLKQARPNVQILFGGPEVSFEGNEFLFHHPYVDFVIQGEGEGPFNAFLEQYSASVPDYSLVPGLLYRSDGVVRVNEPCPPLKFESVPNPYEFLAAEDDKILYYEASRGCPFQCTYCLSSTDTHVRTLPLSRVKEELKYFLYRGVRQVKFVDRTFNCDAYRSLAIMRHLVEHDNGVTNFHLELCGELLTEEHFDVFASARPGLFRVEIGVQSTHAPTLSAIRRTGEFGKIARAVNRLQDIGGIDIHLDLIAGLPYEDYETFRRSFDDVYSLNPDTLQVGFLKMLKGTHIRNEADAHGYVFRRKAPYEVITNSYISADGLVRIKMIENMVDLYHNRGGFAQTLERAIGARKQAFDFYETLALWYYDRSFHQRSHRKVDLYRILRMFLDVWAPDVEGAVWEDLLLDDLARATNVDVAEHFQREGWGLRGQKD